MDNKEWESYITMCPSLRRLDDEIMKVVTAVHTKFRISKRAFVETNLRARGIKREGYSEEEIEKLYDSLVRECLRDHIVETANCDSIRCRHIINIRIAEMAEFIDTLHMVEGPIYVMERVYDGDSETKKVSGSTATGFVILEGLQSLILHACLFPDMPMTMIRYQVTVSIGTINTYTTEER